MSIGERIKEKASGVAGTDPDWYANELYTELSEVGETRFPEIGELCFFSYSAAYSEKYPFYDRRPLVYVMEYQNDKILGANLHYLNPDYRDGIAKGLLNKTSAILPKKTLHRYFFSNIGEPKFRAKQLLSWVHQKGIIDFNLILEETIQS